jgi:hypothetical protein
MSLRGRGHGLEVENEPMQEGMHKLSSPWEGPFEVMEVTRPTSYRLAHLDGTNSWHIDKLRCFYP